MKNSGHYASSSINITKKKKSDSPLKNEHSIHHLDQTNLSSLKKINCLYHKEQNITNFCKAPDCLMPLCPECVKIHTEDHTKLGNYGIYETIEETWGSILREIDEIEDNYSKTKTRLQGLQHSNENAKAILLSHLNDSKRKTIKFIEDFYRGIEGEINEENSIYTKDDLIGMEFTYSKIMERMQEVEKFRKKLRGSKFLKYLIIFKSSEVVSEHLNYNQEIDIYINQMNNKQAFLRDELQPTYAFNFLSQYISLENKRQNKTKLKEPIFQQQSLPYFKEKITAAPPFNYYPQEMPIKQYSDPQSPNRYNPMIMRDPNKMISQMNSSGMALNYENPPPVFLNRPMPQNYENPPPPYFNNRPTPQKNLLSPTVISPQKAKIFGNQNPLNLGLSDFNSPYSLKPNLNNSSNKASGPNEHLNVRSPFKPLGNVEGMSQYQPEGLQEMYYLRPPSNPWE